MAGVFISYRRSDSAGHTGRLASDLAEGLEEQQLFRDIEAIEAGEDFVDALQRAVSACSVMLVVIGPNWATAHTADGKRRLKEPGDFVRMEIEAALGAGNVRVIPVLVGDAQMPQADDLPESMHGLLRRNAYMISDRRWQYDVDQLLNMLEKIPGIASRRETQRPAPPAVSATTPPPSGGMSKLKLGLGAGAVVIATIAALAIFGPREAEQTATNATTTVSSASALPTPATASASTPATPEQAGFIGVWRSEDNAYFDIAADGNGLSIVSGELIDPAKAMTETRGASAPGDELVGRGTINERTIDVTLTDSISKATETMNLTLAPDGQVLEGTITRAGAEPVAILLRRV